MAWHLCHGKIKFIQGKVGSVESPARNLKTVVVVVLFTFFLPLLLGSGQENSKRKKMTVTITGAEFLPKSTSDHRVAVTWTDTKTGPTKKTEIRAASPFQRKTSQHNTKQCCIIQRNNKSTLAIPYSKMYNRTWWRHVLPLHIWAVQRILCWVSYFTVYFTFIKQHLPNSTRQDFVNKKLP